MAQPNEYRITLDHTGDVKLGLLLAMPMCEVSSVGDGLVALWNEQNPTKQVSIGDRVVMVNGATEQLHEALAQQAVLDVVLRRPVKGKQEKEWYQDWDNIFPVVVVFSIVSTFALSFYLHL